MSTSKTEIAAGSGNVFADLDLPDADGLLLKSSLVIALRRLIESRGLSQTAAAKLIGIGQADLSKLLGGRLRGYTVERLMRMLTALDQDIEITVRPSTDPGAGGRIRLAAAG